MRSVIDIYNTALGRLSGFQFNRINSLDNDSTEANLCNTFYPHVREVSLAYCDWAFASTAVALAEKVQGGILRPEYPLRYALPADCLRPVRLLGTCSESNHIPYIVEGRDILTAISPAVLLYIKDVTDPAAWPPHFANAVAFGLAAELSTALENNVNRQEYHTQNAEKALAAAIAIELQGQNPRRKRSAWIASRG